MCIHRKGFISKPINNQLNNSTEQKHKLLHDDIQKT